jgi:AmmeMemoRadiSam system protein A
VAFAYGSASGWSRSSSAANAPQASPSAVVAKASPGAAAVTARPDPKPAAPADRLQVLDPAQQALALRMARRTLELVLAGEPAPDAKQLGVPEAPVWRQHYGTFVTLEHGGNLRGCIGHIVAVEPLWEDIRDNAVAAALSDPRFAAVQLPELAGLDIEVSILTPMAPVPGPDGFVVGRHGVVLAAEGRRAVFLPQVAPEQGWDRDTTLRHLSLKAGLGPDAWRSPSARFEVFEAQVFGEPKRKDRP